MNKKRLLLVSIGFLGVLVVLAAAGFIMTSNSSAQDNQTLSKSPASLPSSQTVSQPSADEQAATEYEAKLDAYFTETKDSASKSESYSSEGYGCSHDGSQAFEWSMED